MPEDQVEALTARSEASRGLTCSGIVERSRETRQEFSQEKQTAVGHRVRGPKARGQPAGTRAGHSIRDLSRAMNTKNISKTLYKICGRAALAHRSRIGSTTSRAAQRGIGFQLVPAAADDISAELD